MNLFMIILLEIVPILMWIGGWYFENSSSKYPDISRGFKLGSVVNSKEAWIYGNKVASKFFSFTGTVLFILIPMLNMFFGVSLGVIAFIIFIAICANLFLIEGMVKKKVKK